MRSCLPGPQTVRRLANRLLSKYSFQRILKQKFHSNALYRYFLSFSTAKSDMSEITHSADPRPLLPLQEKQAASAEVALGGQPRYSLFWKLHQMHWFFHSFSFGQVAATGEKRPRISPQSESDDLASRVLLFHAVPVIVIFLSKFRQINQLSE